MDYEAVEIDFGSGDLAVMCTDGIFEAFNARDEAFGMVRIHRLIAQGGSAREVKDRIVKAVMEHLGSVPPLDDMCLVVVERTCGADANQQVITQAADDELNDGGTKEGVRPYGTGNS